MSPTVPLHDASLPRFADEPERFTFESYVTLAMEISIGTARDPERMADLSNRIASLPIRSAPLPAPLRTRNRRRSGFQAHGGPVPLEELLEHTEEWQLQQLSTIVCHPWLIYALSTGEEKRQLLRLLFSDRCVDGRSLLLKLAPPFDRMMTPGTLAD